MMSVLLVLVSVGRTGVAQAASRGAPHPSTNSKSSSTRVGDEDDSENGSDAEEDEDDDTNSVTNMSRAKEELTKTAGTPASVAVTGRKQELAAEHDEDDDGDTEGEIVGNIALASDYVLRGFTQTGHRPALQGGFDWTHSSGVYLGVWGSNVYFPDSDVTDPNLELDWSGGYKYQFDKSASVKMGLTYFSYFDDASRSGVNLLLRSQVRNFAVELNYSPNWQGEGQSWYMLVSWRREIPLQLFLGLSLGYAIVGGDSSQNYPDGEVNLTREFRGVDLSIAAILVQQQIVNDAVAQSRLVFSASQSF